MRELFAFFSPFYLWLIAAFGLSILHILSLGKFKWGIAAAGCVAGALSALYVGLLFQPLFFLAGWGICFLAVDKIFKKAKSSRVDPDTLKQQTGYVLETVGPETGYVQVGENRWHARHQRADAGAIEIGKPISVIAIEGNTLVVESKPETT